MDVLSARRTTFITRVPAVSYKMLPIILTVLCFFGCSYAQSLDQCPAGLDRDDSLKVRGNLCYRFVLDEPLDYNDANDDCKSHGGTLVLVQSQNVTDYLIDQLVYEFGDANKIWIGLNDKVQEGHYVWEDGTPLGDYTNWGTISANGTSQIHDCVNFDASKKGQWSEDWCSDLLWGLFDHERGYVCQYKIRTTSPSAATV